MKDLISFLYYFSIIFSILMGIDCIRRKDNALFWLLAIFLFHPIGSIIYFFTVKPFTIKFPFLSPHLNPILPIREDTPEERQFKEQVSNIGGPFQYEQLGLYYFKKGYLNKAEKNLRLSLERNPEALSAQYGLAKTLFRNENLPEAIELLESVLKKDPKFDYGYALFGLADCYRMNGDNEKALELYEKVSKTYSFFRANVQYAELLEENNRLEEARNIMRSVVDSSKTIPDYKREQEIKWIEAAERFLKKHP